MSFAALSDDERGQLKQAVQDGLDASRQSASKWNTLYAWLQQRFELAEGDLRASLLAEIGNIGNRVPKDNAWTNPKVLILVLDPEGDVDLNRARQEVRGYIRAFAERLDATSHLRVVLYFQGDQLVHVDKIRFARVEVSTEMKAGEELTDAD